MKKEKDIDWTIVISAAFLTAALFIWRYSEQI